MAVWFTKRVLTDGLKVMADLWFFNAPLYSLFSGFNFAHIKLLLLAIFTLFYFIGWRRLWWKSENKLLKGHVLFGLFFVILPAFNAWYLIFADLLEFFMQAEQFWLPQYYFF